MKRLFAGMASHVAVAAGSPYAFIACALIVIVWAACGPIAHYSDTWQLIINTGTTIVTFLMVFLIQNSQNRDGAAIQAKLDELIRVSTGKNAFIGIEHLTQEELEDMRQLCQRAADRSVAAHKTTKKTSRRKKVTAKAAA